MEIQKIKPIEIMKIFLKIAGIVLIMTTSFSVTAQKKPFYDEQEQVIEAAYKQLDYSMKEGLLKEWKEEKSPEGSYTMKLTIKHKGQVVTINPLEREGGDIPTQNALKNFMKEYAFPFKMPKDKSYQFIYEFKF